MSWRILLLFCGILAALEILARCWFPFPREEVGADEVPIGSLQRKYAIWEKWSALPYLLSVVALTFGWFYLFRFLWDWLHLSLPAGEILLLPSVAWFFLPAFFLGLLTAAFPALMFLRLCLGSDYADYTRYTTERAKVSPVVVAYRIALVAVPLSVGFALLTCDCYTRMTPREFAENGLFSLGESVYPLGDIVELREVAGFFAPNGDHVHTPYYEIVFRDGHRWHTAQNFYQMPHEAYGPLMERLMEETGKPLVQYELPP